MGRIARGWQLTKASFEVLKLDKEILVLPVLSFLSLVVLLGAEFGIGLVTLGFPAEGEPVAPLWYVLLFITYVTSAFVGTFFLAATIEMAAIRLAGGDPVVRDGLRKAWAKKGILLQWAIVAATVGVILRMLRDRAGALGQIAISLVELGWAIATYFAVPVLVYRGVGPIDAVKQSAALVKRTWGEAATGVVSTGLIFFLLGLLGLVPLLMVAVTTANLAVLATVAVIVVIYWIVLGAASQAIRGILVAALYQYADTGEMPSGFEAAAPGAS